MQLEYYVVYCVAEERQEWHESFDAQLKRQAAREAREERERLLVAVKIRAWHCLNCDTYSEGVVNFCKSQSEFLLFLLSLCIVVIFSCRS